MDYCFSLFAFGQRYIDQCNKFLEQENLFDIKCFVLTNLPDKINKKENVIVVDSAKYGFYDRLYVPNYWIFDFHLKRYCLKECFDCGYEKVVMIDNDVELVDKDLLQDCFFDNCISGPTIYEHSLVNCSRFKFYHNFINIEFKEKIFTPEDCITHFCLNKDVFDRFYDKWGDLHKVVIENKNVEGFLHPRGCLLEMTYSALHCGIGIAQSKPRCFAQNHNKWYL